MLVICETCNGSATEEGCPKCMAEEVVRLNTRFNEMNTPTGREIEQQAEIERLRADAERYQDLEGSLARAKDEIVKLRAEVEQLNGVIGDAIVAAVRSGYRFPDG